jgi:hypothetical protein
MAQVPDVDMLTTAMDRELPGAPGLTDDIDGQPPHRAQNILICALLETAFLGDALGAVTRALMGFSDAVLAA